MIRNGTHKPLLAICLTLVLLAAVGGCSNGFCCQWLTLGERATRVSRKLRSVAPCCEYVPDPVSAGYHSTCWTDWSPEWMPCPPVYYDHMEPVEGPFDSVEELPQQPDNGDPPVPELVPPSAQSFDSIEPQVFMDSVPDGPALPPFSTEPPWVMLEQGAWTTLQ